MDVRIRLPVLVASVLLVACAAAVPPSEETKPPPVGGDLDVRLVLEDGVTPVPRCRVALLWSEPRAIAGWSPLQVDQTTLDGTARFHAVEPGRYAVAAGLCGEALGILDFVGVEAGKPAHLDVKVRGVADVVGKVAGGAGVRLWLAGATAIADAEGRFAFCGVCFGHVTAQLEQEFMSGSADGLPSGGQFVGAPITIHFRPGVVDLGTIDLRLDSGSSSIDSYAAIDLHTWLPRAFPARVIAAERRRYRVR